MRNKDKIRAGLIIGLLLIVIGAYYIFQPSNTPALTVANQSNVTSDGQVKGTNSQSNKVTGQKAGNQTSNQNSNQNINANEVVYNGKTYKIFTGLNALGEGLVVCPYCGKTASDAGSSEKGEYWYYYYHCSSCGANIAEKALNH